MGKLSPKEINRRMTQWRNDRMLEEKRSERIHDLQEEQVRLKEENRQLRETVALQQATIEKLLVRIEQLETMVFGKKRDDDDAEDSSGSCKRTPKEPIPPRSSASFRRARPRPEEVTHRTHHPLDACPDCGTALRRKETVTRYEEDIPLPQKIVTERTIERGYCPRCKLWKSALPLSSQHCTLGGNVRLYVLFALTVLGQTFEKIKAHLFALHRMSLSDGEIAAMIQQGHRTFLPAKQKINEKIDAAPAAHYDETVYPVQNGEQGDYAWAKTASDGPETVFLLGRTRGKDNARELRGPPSTQAGVTDDYAGYDGLFENHGLCWTHPLRKFRDLAESDALRPVHHTQCLRFYGRFHALEREVAAIVATPFDPMLRPGKAEEIGRKIDQLMAPESTDMELLARYKRTFLEHREKYLLCIRMRDVPMTNNKAERVVRGLVIKRLLSFGCRSQKGAQAMETILSVCLTLWWSKPKDYFGELRRLMAPA